MDDPRASEDETVIDADQGNGKLRILEFHAIID